MISNTLRNRLIILVLILGGIIIGVVTLISVNDTEAVLRHAKKQLSENTPERLQEAFPEGHFFGVVLYGLIWVEYALESDDTTIILQAEQEALWALTTLETDPRILNGFYRELHPRYGMFYAGWHAYLLSKIVELNLAIDGESSHVIKYRERCDAIANALRTSACPYIETYPGSAWPGDNAVAVSALARYDQIVEVRYNETVTNWVAVARTMLDDETGLIPHYINSDRCVARGGARGSSTSLVLVFLPDIAPSFSQEQYAKFGNEFYTHFAGCSVVREYPKGTNASGDVDSGPVIFGVGPVATIVGIAAAYRNNDHSKANAISFTVAGGRFPTLLMGGRRYDEPYLLIAELFIAWANLQRSSYE